MMPQQQPSWGSGVVDQLQQQAMVSPGANSFGGQIMQMLGAPDKNNGAGQQPGGNQPGMGGGQQPMQYGMNEKGADMLFGAGKPAGGEGSSGGIIGEICCFIFLEAYAGKLPGTVRKWRDYYYAKYPAIARGYIRMAKWLVPMMRKFSPVRVFVQTFMTGPITRAGIERDAGKRSFRAIIAHFWLFVWLVTGIFTKKEAK